MTFNQKGAAPLLILFAGLSIIIYIVYLGYAPIKDGLFSILNRRSDSEASDGRTCYASEAQEFKDCLSLAREESISKIEITDQIACGSKDQCRFSLDKRSSPLTITGKPDSNAGFRRFTNYDYPLLVLGDFGKVNTVSNVTLKNLFFYEGTQECDFTTEFTPDGLTKCDSPLVLTHGVEDSVIDGVTITNSKSHGIQIAGVNNVTIKNSILYNSGGNGIWFSSAFPPGECKIDFANYKVCPIDENTISKYITIENNLIAESRIAAIEIYAFGDAQKPTSIKGNLLVHNHRDARYKTCPPPKGSCAGGQLAISRSKHIIVEENIIRDGLINAIDPTTGKTYDSQGLKATGIELGDSMSNIMIKNNSIYGNSGAAVFADYLGSEYKVESVGIYWNLIHGNGSNLIGKAEPDLAKAYGFGVDKNVIEIPNHPTNQKKAYIFMDPPVCITRGGQCDSVVRWYSNDYPNLKVSLRQNPELIIATGPYGKQDINWVTREAVNLTVCSVDSPCSGQNILGETRAQAVSPVRLSANPNPCTLDSSGKCTTKISWVSLEEIKDLEITIKENPGSLFARSAYGSNEVNWITSAGATFEAYSGKQLLASINAIGVQGSSPTPNPSESAIPSPSPSPSTIPSPSQSPSPELLPSLPGSPRPSQSSTSGGVDNSSREATITQTSCSTSPSGKTVQVNSASSITWTYTYPASTRITSVSFPRKAGFKYSMNGQTSTPGQGMQINLEGGQSRLEFTVMPTRSCSSFFVPLTFVNSCGQKFTEYVNMRSRNSYGRSVCP